MDPDSSFQAVHNRLHDEPGSNPAGRVDTPASEGRDAASRSFGGSFRFRSTRLSPLQALAVARERRLWNRRAATWDDDGSAGLGAVVEAVLRECRRVPGAVAVDLGAGSGQVTIPLARTCGRVLAVDVSPSLLEGLAEKADADGIRSIELVESPIETLDLPPRSLDLVVSNYTLHHLRDVDKARLLRRSFDWLKPGGRLVIGDMMFGRQINPDNRQIVVSKASAFLRRGPAGWLRLVKNLARFALRIREKPLPPEMWETLAREAGFDNVSISRVVSEACILVAVKPG